MRPLFFTAYAHARDRGRGGSGGAFSFTGSWLSESTDRTDNSGVERCCLSCAADSGGPSNGLEGAEIEDRAALAWGRARLDDNEEVYQHIVSLC